MQKDPAAHLKSFMFSYRNRMIIKTYINVFPLIKETTPSDKLLLIIIPYIKKALFP